VTYRGQDIYLTYVEYRQLKLLALDDPVEGEAMARRILDKQRRP
jgi:hypothetical protein